MEDFGSTIFRNLCNTFKKNNETKMLEEFYEFYFRNFITTLQKKNGCEMRTKVSSWQRNLTCERQTVIVWFLEFTASESLIKFKQRRVKVQLTGVKRNWDIFSHAMGSVFMYFTRLLCLFVVLCKRSLIPRTRMFWKEDTPFTLCNTNSYL